PVVGWTPQPAELAGPAGPGGRGGRRERWRGARFVKLASRCRFQAGQPARPKPLTLPMETKTRIGDWVTILESNDGDAVGQSGLVLGAQTISGKCVLIVTAELDDGCRWAPGSSDHVQWEGN